MTKSEIFKAARKMARSMVKEVGDYLVALKIALKEVYSKMSNATETTKEKAIRIGGKLWEKGEHSRVYFDMPATLFSVDFGSKNKNFKANLVKMYFNCADGKLYCDNSKFSEALVAAAINLIKA